MEMSITAILDALLLATCWNFARVRNECIKSLVDLGPAMRIGLGMTFGIEDWISHGMKELVFQDDPLTIRDAMIIGPLMSVKVSELREKRLRLTLKTADESPRVDPLDKIVEITIFQDIERCVRDEAYKSHECAEDKAQEPERKQTDDAGSSRVRSRSRDEPSEYGGHELTDNTPAEGSGPRWPRSRLNHPGERTGSDDGGGAVPSRTKGQGSWRSRQLRKG